MQAALQTGHADEETTMRPAFLYYLAQTRIADLYRHAQREAPAGVLAPAVIPANTTARVPRRGLAAGVARRMLTALAAAHDRTGHRPHRRALPVAAVRARCPPS
jgi:hypothetical protein